MLYEGRTTVFSSFIRSHILLCRRLCRFTALPPKTHTTLAPCLSQVYTSPVGCDIRSACVTRIPAPVTVLGAYQSNAAWTDATARLAITTTGVPSGSTAAAKDSAVDATALTLTVYRKHRAAALLQFYINCQ